MLISEGSQESITAGIKGVGRDTVRMMLHAFKLRFNTTLPYTLVYVVVMLFYLGYLFPNFISQLPTQKRNLYS
jgi:hypothetical protein